MRLQSVPNKMEHGGYMRVSTAVMKDHIQKQLGEERMLFGSHFHITVIFQGGQDRNSNRAGTWRQPVMQRPWRDAAGENTHVSQQRNDRENVVHLHNGVLLSY